MTDETQDNQSGDDDARQQEDTTALKSALQKERERARELEKTAKAYAGLGMSPEEIAELKTAREKAEEEAARKAGDFDALRTKLTEQHTGELTKLQEQIKAIAASEHEARVESGLKSALMEAGVSEEGASLLPDILKSRAKIEQDGDKRVVKIFDADGSPMLAKDGRDATFADLVASASEKYPSLFKATTKPGSGTPPGGNSAGSTASQVVKASALEGMTTAQKAAYFQANPNVQVTD
jgi:hypothetical protein